MEENDFERYLLRKLLDLPFRACSWNDKASPSLALETNCFQDVCRETAMFFPATGGGQCTRQTIVPAQLA